MTRARRRAPLPRRTFAGIERELAAIDTAALDADQQVDHGVLTALTRGAGRDAAHSLWAANASAKGYVSRQGLSSRPSRP